jgi:hypothetical protein
MSNPIELRPLGIGVVLALYPNRDPTHSMEIQRAPNDSGIPDVSGAETIEP